MSEYAVVLTTCSNKEDAEVIARKLLADQLAACIQVFPINSYYTWNGQVNQDPEHLLFVKCRAERYKDVESCIKSVHKYEVPEIIQLPIVAGSQPYLEWMKQVTK